MDACVFKIDLKKTNKPEKDLVEQNGICRLFMGDRVRDEVAVVDNVLMHHLESSGSIWPVLAYTCFCLPRMFEC